MVNDVTILSRTEYGVPSGNYDGSSQDWTSDAQQAANYYRGRGSAQTINISVDLFEGRIFIEATLDSDAETATWFNTYSYGDGSSIPITDFHPATISGNFTWMRVRIEGFSGGTINLINMVY